MEPHWVIQCLIHQWPETHGSVSLGQQHPQVSLAGFAEVRALLSKFCRKGRGAPHPGGQCSGQEAS